MKFAEVMKNVAISMRPKQWIKNAFVFAALIFSGSFLQPALIVKSIYSFVLFCLVSGSVYLINDCIDRKKDALHPVKCRRPIAAGRLSVRAAMVSSVAALLIAMVLAWFFDLWLFVILLGYFVLVLAYSLVLKNVVILDVIVLSLGFVLRTAGGAVAIHVWISPWLLLCTTLLALFLALNKRRNELQVMSEKAGEHKKSLSRYTPELIGSMLSVITSVTVMAYCLYTFSSGKSPYMMLTIPFVLYGIFRYQYLSTAKGMGGSPEVTLLKDKPLLADVLLWVAASLIIVALNH